MATMVASGMVRQISATLRHGIKLPSKKTMKKPSVAEMPAQAVSIPRMDGSHISPTYVMIGASIRPTPKPNSTWAENKAVSVCALYIMIQAMICGMFTRNMAFLRPSGSASQPENRLPTGWHMYAMLPSHDTCAGDKCNISLALLMGSLPVSAGMTMVANDTDNPRSSSRKFFAVLARICERRRTIRKWN